MDRLERIRHWQWIAIALLIGLGIGWARENWLTRVGGFGETLNNQADLGGVIPDVPSTGGGPEPVRILASVPAEPAAISRGNVLQKPLSDNPPLVSDNPPA